MTNAEREAWKLIDSTNDYTNAAFVIKLTEAIQQAEQRAKEIKKGQTKRISYQQGYDAGEQHGREGWKKEAVIATQGEAYRKGLLRSIEVAYTLPPSIHRNMMITKLRKEAEK